MSVRILRVPYQPRIVCGVCDKPIDQGHEAEAGMDGLFVLQVRTTSGRIDFPVHEKCLYSLPHVERQPFRLVRNTDMAVDIGPSCPEYAERPCIWRHSAVERIGTDGKPYTVFGCRLPMAEECPYAIELRQKAMMCGVGIDLGTEPPGVYVSPATLTGHIPEEGDHA